MMEDTDRVRWSAPFLASSLFSMCRWFMDPFGGGGRSIHSQ